MNGRRVKDFLLPLLLYYALLACLARGFVSPSALRSHRMRGQSFKSNLQGVGGGMGGAGNGGGGGGGNSGGGGGGWGRMQPGEYGGFYAPAGVLDKRLSNYTKAHGSHVIDDLIVKPGSSVRRLGLLPRTLLGGVSSLHSVTSRSLGALWPHVPPLGLVVAGALSAPRLQGPALSRGAAAAGGVSLLSTLLYQTQHAVGRRRARRVVVAPGRSAAPAPAKPKPSKQVAPAAAASSIKPPVDAPVITAEGAEMLYVGSP